MHLPKLDDIPSPSLRRMRRMNAGELRAYLARLEAEHQRITERLDRLAHQRDDEGTRRTREARMERASKQQERLGRLIEVGRWLL